MAFFRTLLPPLASLALTGVAFAGEILGPKAVEAAVAPPTDAPSTVLGLGLNTNDNMTEGSAFLVQPLWDNVGQRGTMGGSIFFAEPYFTWGEEGELSGSLGLGFRHLFSNEPVGGGNRVSGLLAEGLFVGANVFTDYKRTQADSDLWQLGMGIETGARYLELRANYYLPLTDDESISRFDATTFTPTTVGGRPAIRATTRTIDIIEEPMEGWDAELALLIPGLDKYFDVRLIGGYYSFETNTSGNALLYSADVEGWKAGVEVRPVPAVVLAGMWYEDENLVQDNWMVSVRLEVPLGKPASESFTPRRRHLQERLLEPVHRQNAAIQTGVSFEPSRVRSTTTLTNAQQAQRFLSDLKGWGAVYTGKASSSSDSSDSSSSNSTSGAVLVLSNSSGSTTSSIGGGGTGGLLKLSGGSLSGSGSSIVGANGFVVETAAGNTSTERPLNTSGITIGGSLSTINNSNNVTFNPGGSVLLFNNTYNTGQLILNGTLLLNAGNIVRLSSGGTVQLTGGNSTGGTTQP